MKNICKRISEEFQCQKFGLNYDKVEDFYQSQWQNGTRNSLYFIYRWIWFLFFFCVLTSVLILQFNGGKAFIFVTNWGIILCTLTNLFGVILVTRWYFNIGSVRTAPIPASIKSNTSIEKIQRTPILVKMYWMCHAVMVPLSFTISIVYWTFLHGKMDHPPRFPVMSFVTHCLNSVFTLIDFWVVAFPMRLLHTVYVLLLTVIYMLFSVGYYLAGGTDEYGRHHVYPILNWDYPERVLITIGGIIILYIIFALLLFGLFLLKKFIYNALQRWHPHFVDLY